MPLGPGGDAGGSRRLRALAGSLVLACLGGLACAHGSTAGTSGDAAMGPALATVDAVDEQGAAFSLGRHLGSPVVLELCAAWSDPCLLNAKALHDVCTQACRDGVVVISILLDDLGAVAVRSYRQTLGYRQGVARPGPQLQGGRSALGPIVQIPRLLIFDRHGRIVEDIAGSVVSAAGILRRLEGLR